MEQISYVGDTGGDAYLDVHFYKGFHEGEEADFVRIAVPGDKTLTIDTIADDYHKQRFNRQWAAYEGFKDIKGHPIDEWEEIPQTLRTELNYQGFKFVEQIAGAPDSAFNRMMGGSQIRNKAQSFLNRGKINADVMIQKQAEQIEELQEKMAILLEAMNDKKPQTRNKSVPLEE